MGIFVNANNRAALALADGTVFWGRGFGKRIDSNNPVVGEVVFNTSLYGYQEILTDPSYYGQIMTFTCPHIGNYGCNSLDVESDVLQVKGVIIRNESLLESNFRSEESLATFLERNGAMGLAGIDTRELVSHIRDTGAQMGALAWGADIDSDALVAAAKASGSMLGKDYVQNVTCKEPYVFTEFPWQQKSNSYPQMKSSELLTRPHVVVLDCGVKKNILRLLLKSGFRITVVPASTKAEEIFAFAPDAVFLSNGPGDPAVHTAIVSEIQEMLGKLPIFGICLGHQLLALAIGAKTYKLKFGHRGGNHPVLESATGVIEITSQNHGFAVSEESIPDTATITHINLNDQTVEGLAVLEKNAFSVQYHPEASPGPHDSAYLFDRFFENVVGYKA